MRWGNISAISFFEKMKHQTKKRLIGGFGALYLYSMLYATKYGSTIFDVNADVGCGDTQFGYICDVIVGTVPVFGSFVKLVIAIFPIIIVISLLFFIVGIFHAITKTVKEKLKR